MAPVAKRVTDRMLQWYGHVKIWDEGNLLGRMVHAPVGKPYQETDGEEAEHQM